MIRFLIKRFFYALATIAAVVVIITSIIYLAPVDPARLTFGQRSDMETIEAKRRQLGLDQPLYIQLAAYLNDISPISIHKPKDSIPLHHTISVERRDTVLNLFSARGTDAAPVNGPHKKLSLITINILTQERDSAIQYWQQHFSTPGINDSTPEGVVLVSSTMKTTTEYLVIDNRKQYNYLRLLALGRFDLVIKRPYLRESYQTGRPVIEILTEVIPRTALLALAAMGMATVLGIVLGVFAALKQHTWFDNSSVVMSVLGYSLPSYITAILLAYVFGYLLADYTGLNVRGSLTDIDTLTGETYIVWKNLLLPAIALGIRPVAIITQLTRSAMLDVMSSDYVRTARSKGLSERVVIFRHALRNALNPVVTAISGWFAALLAGAFFVENVFSYNGLGYQTVQSLLHFDVPVVLGAVLFTACIFVVINTMVDFIYAWLDPRVTVGK